VLLKIQDHKERLETGTRQAKLYSRLFGSVIGVGAFLAYLSGGGVQAHVSAPLIGLTETTSAAQQYAPPVLCPRAERGYPDDAYYDREAARLRACAEKAMEADISFVCASITRDPGESQSAYLDRDLARRKLCEELRKALPRYTPRPIEQPVPKSTPTPPPASPKPSPSSPRVSFVSGTAFLVKPGNLLVTAYHVVEDAIEIQVTCGDGELRSATLHGKAPQMDLALLRLAGTPMKTYLPILTGSSGRLGQRVMTIGFPVPDILGTSPKYSEGTITSMSGRHDDASFLQISVPIQPGNSGGALMDEAGRVLGVVVSSAAPVFFLRETGTLPQGVNFAVKATFLRSLFDLSEPDKGPAVAQTREQVISNATAATCLVVSTLVK
jgi:S1-C subfamily serine protease